MLRVGAGVITFQATNMQLPLMQGGLNKTPVSADLAGLESGDYDVDSSHILAVIIQRSLVRLVISGYFILVRPQLIHLCDYQMQGGFINSINANLTIYMSGWTGLVQVPAAFQISEHTTQQSRKIMCMISNVRPSLH